MYAKLPEERRAFGAKNHTRSEQLRSVGQQSQTRLAHCLSRLDLLVARTRILRLVVLTTGELHSTPDVLQKEIRSRYSGNFVIGRDLDVY